MPGGGGKAEPDGCGKPEAGWLNDGTPEEYGKIGYPPEGIGCPEGNGNPDEAVTGPTGNPDDAVPGGGGKEEPDGCGKPDAGWLNDGTPEEYGKIG